MQSVIHPYGHWGDKLAMVRIGWATKMKCVRQRVRVNGHFWGYNKTSKVT